MSRAVHMIIFLTIASLLVGSAHFYVFSRLSHYLSSGGSHRKAIALLSAALLIMTLAGLLLTRVLPREIAMPLAWVTFSWMGIILLLTLVMLVTDVTYVAATTALAAPLLADPERRLALQKLFGVAALGATGFLTGFSLWNALRPVAVKPMEITLKRLPAALNGLRIVQLTDLHLGPTIDGAWLKHVVEKTNALNPDIIAITGDLVDGSVKELGGFASALKDLRAKYGVFFVTGNHEYYSGVDQWVAYLPSLGVRVLRNERETIEINGAKIDIAGVDDFASGQFPGHGPDLPKALAGRETSRPVILLAHQPAAIKEAAEFGVDLQLSGHTHGGQIWPWRYLVLLQQPYVSGLHKHGDTDSQIYVSEGTGYWGPPMRFGTAAEITDITLRATV